MIAYYAHPMTIYGTNQENRDIALMYSLGWDVENPNKPEHQEGYKREGMDYFLAMIEKCHVLAFRAFPSGEIPAGVKKEIDHAINLSKPVIELPTGIIRRALDVDETREVIRESGAR
jgi:hypothetical protein